MYVFVQKRRVGRHPLFLQIFQIYMYVYKYVYICMYTLMSGGPIGYMYVCMYYVYVQKVG